MGLILNFLVADIAEKRATIKTIEHIAFSSFGIDLFAFRAADQKVCIYPRNTVVTQMLLHHFIIDIERKQVRFLVEAFGLFLVMFLSFRWQIARPTKLLPTSTASDMCASRFVPRDADAAPRVGTSFRALFEVQVIQHIFILFVFIKNFHDFLVVSRDVNNIDWASFERMSLLSTV